MCAQSKDWTDRRARISLQGNFIQIIFHRCFSLQVTKVEPLNSFGQVKGCQDDTSGV